jgi:hypothetical protein|tara:strand:+ start:160 stop:357 length:198 start_codon:yes stop_codon:yes gene_type:complete
LSSNTDQFKELILEIKYATGLVKSGKYNLGEYYNHMAGFFNYIDLPEDAQEFIVLAKKWEKQKGE